MNGRKLTTFCGFILFVLFLVGIIYAQETVLDTFQMKSDYPHKKGIVNFTHTKHIDEYEIGCGQCHHDDQGIPLENLQITDDVQKCIDCHSKPGERPKGKDAPKLNKQQRLDYHAEALHYNCKGCHKQHNKQHKSKAAPTTCTKCHPKKSKPAPPSGLTIKTVA